MSKDASLIGSARSLLGLKTGLRAPNPLVAFGPHAQRRAGRLRALQSGRTESAGKRDLGKLVRDVTAETRKKRQVARASTIFIPNRLAPVGGLKFGAATSEVRVAASIAIAKAAGLQGGMFVTHINRGISRLSKQFRSGGTTNPVIPPSTWQPRTLTERLPHLKQPSTATSLAY